MHLLQLKGMQSSKTTVGMWIVSLAVAFSIVTGGAVRDDTKNGGEGD